MCFMRTVPPWCGLLKSLEDVLNSTEHIQLSLPEIFEGLTSTVFHEDEQFQYENSSNITLSPAR